MSARGRAGARGTDAEGVCKHRMMEFTSYTSNFKDMSAGGKKSTIIMSHDPREVTGIVARLRSFMGIGADFLAERLQGRAPPPRSPPLARADTRSQGPTWG